MNEKSEMALCSAATTTFRSVIRPAFLTTSLRVMESRSGTNCWMEPGPDRQRQRSVARVGE
jgi:hypothetical protein